MKEITVKISRKNYDALKKAIKRNTADAVVNKALKQFFDKNHKMKMRVLLKNGYRAFGKVNLRLSEALEEDADF